MYKQGVVLGQRSWGANGPPCSLPNMSSDTGVRRMSPVNSQVVFWASIPEVPSNTCGTKDSYSDKGLAGENGGSHSRHSPCPALS
jgi:hypothetical protein